MQGTIMGEAIILSQEDADEIAQAVADLTTVIWDTLSKRRILLKPPAGQQPARIRAPRLAKSAPLDELF